MKTKAIRITFAALVSLAGLFAAAGCFSEGDTAADETVQKAEVLPSDSHLTTVYTPTVTSAATENAESPGIPNASTLEAPQTPDIYYPSENTIRFAGVECDFSQLNYYSESGLSYGEYSATLISGEIATIEFSEEALQIDKAIIQLEEYYSPASIFIVDLDVTDEYQEIFLCEYSTVNTWITQTIYRYDGDSIIELARLGGWAYIDSNGKLIITDAGDLPGLIADPRITRSYYELRNGKLVEVLVPIKDASFTFADNDTAFHFYETPDAPTPEFADKVISETGSINGCIYAKDFAGQRFTILDHSEQQYWNRGAWYYVQLEDGRKGVIHWWYAG